jgi:hypothetical protein
VPRLAVARRQRGPGREHADVLLTAVTLVAHDVPAGVVPAAMQSDVRRLRLQRRVHGPVREVQQEGLGRVGRLHLAHHVDGVVGEVVGEVVAVGVAVDGDGVVVLHQPVRVVVVGEPVEDAVVAVEPSL